MRRVKRKNEVRRRALAEAIEPRVMLSGTPVMVPAPPTNYFSTIAGMITFSNQVFFAAQDSSHGIESLEDRRDDEPSLVKDINTFGSSYPADFCVCNGLLFFSATDSSHGDELWKTDGTTAGTVMVKDINPGSSGSGATRLTSFSRSPTTTRGPVHTHGETIPTAIEMSPSSTV